MAFVIVLASVLLAGCDIQETQRQLVCTRDGTLLYQSPLSAFITPRANTASWNIDGAIYTPESNSTCVVNDVY
ncbi:hypothetical protein L2Y94_06645 [Luteibacter aegosomatis]|uniref:hypothetical protein n=1 Tax=Luteibacter aegosomatis TaxID=2911537 RepID=UPI001FF84F3C|nr:hypothetical protein [Luteibacter aegosomatis]UPG87030.1 hypothetical protein L2Y94_06645 [Luteibacter aegosomatis]